jgi:autotransporter-associated beta strand protein
MASPRRTFNKKRQNALWLMNAASLVVVMGAVSQATKSTIGKAVSNLVPRVQAVAYVWDGGVDSNPDGNSTSPWVFNTATNWVSDTAPATFTAKNSTDTYTFDATGGSRTSITWGTALTGNTACLGAVTFASNATSAYTFTDVGTNNNFTLNAALTNNYVGTTTFDIVITNANASNTWTSSTGATTYFKRYVYLNTGSSTSNRTLTLTGAGNFIFDQGIRNNGTYNGIDAKTSDNAVSTSQALNTTSVHKLTITSTGTTWLKGNNTVSGQLLINGNGGTIKLDGDNTSVGLYASLLNTLSGPITYSQSNEATYAIKLIRGTVLLGNSKAIGNQDFTAGSSSTATGETAALYTNAAITISNNIYLGATGSSTGVYAFGGNADVNSTFSGAITLQRNSTIYQAATTGSNKLTVSNAISAGTNAITANAIGNIEISGQITGSGAMNKTGAGILTLSGTNASTYSGAVTITNGTIKYGSSSTGALGSGNVIVTSGGTLDLQGNTITATSHNVSGSIINSSSSDATYSGKFIISGTSASLSATNGNIIVSGATGDVSSQANASAVAIDLSAGKSLTLDGTTTGNVFSSILYGGSGTPTVSSIIKKGTGTWTISGVSFYSTSGNGYGIPGNLKITNGILKLGAANVVGNSSSNNNQAVVITNGSLDLNSFSTGGYKNATIVLGGYGFLNNGALINSNASVTTITSPIQLSADSSIIANNGAINITPSNSAYRALSLSLGPSNYNLTLGGTTGGTINSSIYGGGKIIIGGTGIWTLTPNNIASTVWTVYGNTVDGSNKLDITGTTAAAATNPFTGGIDVNYGTLKVGVVGGLGTGTVTVSSGATYDLAGITPNTSPSLKLSGTGLTASPNGALSNSGTTAATYSGAVTINNDATIKAGSGNITLTGGIDTNGKTLTIDGSNNVTVSTGVISGTSGALTKNGTGTLTISSGTHSYSGATSVTAGTVDLSSGATLSNSAVTVGTSGSNSGTLKGSGTITNGLTIYGSVNPGSAGIGTLRAGATDLKGGGILNIQFNSSSGIGWDLLSTGALTVSSTSTLGSQFNINLLSISSPSSDTSGAATTFDSSVDAQKFEIIKATSLAATFDASLFKLDTSQFMNSLNGGTWALDVGDGTTTNANSLYLVFSKGSLLYYNGGTWDAADSSIGGPSAWNGTNWDSTYTAVFTGTGGIVTIGNSETVSATKGITFSSTGFTISGGTLALSDSANRNTITVNTGSSSGTAEISSALTGLGGLTKSGNGILTLSGNNDALEGGLAISAGVVKVGNAKSLGKETSAVTVNGSGVLDLNGITLTNANALNIQGTASLINTATSEGKYLGDVKLTGASSYVVSTGNINMAGSTNLNGFGLTLTGGASGLTLGGPISGSGNITIAPGAGTTSLNGSIGNTGTVTITSTQATPGLTTLGGNLTASVSSLNIGTSTAAGSFKGTVLVSGDNTYYNGTTTLSSGTLKLGSTSALGSGALIMSQYSTGAALDLNGKNFGNAVSLYSTGISSTGGIINSSTSAATLSGTITVVNTSSIGTTGGDITLSGTIKSSTGGTRALSLIGNTSTATTITINSGFFSDSTFTLQVGSSGSDKVQVSLLGAQLLKTTGNIKIAGGTLLLSAPSTLNSSSMSMNAGGSTGDNSRLLLTSNYTYTFGSLGIGGILKFDTTSNATPTTITFKEGGNGVTNTSFGQTGSASKTLNVASGVNLIIGSAGSLTYFDLVGDTALSNKILKLDGAGTYTFNSVLRDANTSTSSQGFIGGINIVGNTNPGGAAAMVTLNAANTYTGGTSIGTASTLKIGNATALGANSSTVAVLAGATLDLNGTTMTGTNALTLGSSTTAAGTVTNTSSSSNATYAGSLTLGGNATLTAANKNLTFSNPADITGAYTLTLNGANDGSLAGALKTSTGGLNKSGAGNWTLNGTGADYSGSTVITAGKLTLGASDVIGTGAVTISGGAILDLGSNTDSVGAVTLTDGSITGSGTLTSTDSFAVAKGTISANLAGSVGLTKTTSDTVTLSGANTYTGSTAINAGTLKVNGTLTNSNASVAGGANLEGKGTISGTVTVADNGSITAGDSSLIDTLRGSLTVTTGITFSSQATLYLSNVNAANASTIAAGAITASGGAKSITININNTISLDNADYTLLSYSTLNDFSVFNLVSVANITSRQSFTLFNDEAKKLVMMNIAGGTVRWAGDASPTPLWTTTVGNKNWKLSTSGAATDYVLGDFVTFDDTATNTTVTIAEEVSPNSLVFDNSTKAYSVTSTNLASIGISGQTDLVKNGTQSVDLDAPLKITGGITVNAGTLSLNNSNNTFTGNITLNGSAILKLGASGALGTSNSLTFGPAAIGKLSLNSKNGTLTGLYNDAVSLGSPLVENGGSTDSTLTLNINSGTSAFSGLIRDGDGTTGKLLLIKSGNGTLVLTQNNTNTGLTTISGGKLQLGNNGTTGSVGGNIFINTSGTLDFSRTNDLSYSSALSGSGIVNLNSGGLELLGANTFTGAMNISSGTKLTVGSSGSISSSMAITNNGTFEYNSSTSAYSLGAIGGTGSLNILANIVTQTGTNSLTGSINIGTGATYAIATNGSFTSASSVINHGTLSFGARSADFTFNKDVSGSGNLVSNVGVGRIFFVTGNNTYIGTTTISSGKLNLGNSGGTGSLGTGGIVIASGAELILSKNIDTIISGGITGSGSITLGGTGTVTLSSSSPINLTDANSELKFGSTAGSTFHSTLDLSYSSATVGKFTVQTDATANSGVNNVIIGNGKSLNVMGLVTIGFNNGSNPVTNLTMSGEGTFNIGTLASPTGVNVNVGGSTTSSKINYVTWDMSLLSALNMYLGAGTFSIGADKNSSGSVANNFSTTGATVILPTTSTIVATTLLMDAPESGKTFYLKLGAGDNTLNVNTITLGGNGTRATNNLSFNSGTGTLYLRSLNGSGATTLDVLNSTRDININLSSSVDLTGHSADLLLGAVTVAKLNALTGTGTGGGSGKLAFDTGKFEAASLTIANKSNSGTQSAGTLNANTASSSITGNIVGLVSFGGGKVKIGSVDLARHGATNVGGTVQGLMEFFGSNSSTVGAVTIANADARLVSGVPNVKGIINIADNAAVSITSINGASAAANTTATAEINITGGTLTLGGNITRTGGAGTSAFNLNLSGGILDMGKNAIGTGSSAVNFTWTGGILKNVSDLNGSTGNTNIIGSTFNLAGENTFSSTITIKANTTLELQSNTALGLNSKIAFDGANALLKAGDGVTSVSGNLTTGAAQFDTNSNNVTFTNLVSGLSNFTKLGSGKLILSSSGGNLATSVSVTEGVLQIGTGDGQAPGSGFLSTTTTSLTLDSALGDTELNVNGVQVDLNTDITLIGSGAKLSGTKGANYSYNFLKDIILQPGGLANITASDMITGSNSHIDVGSGATLTVSGSFIDGNNTQHTQITKNGAGTLELTGTGNTYSGATTVNAGTLTFSQGVLTGSSTAITVNNGANLTAVDLDANVSLNVTAGGTADLSGTNLEINALDGAGSVLLSGSTPTLTVSSGAFAGNLSSTDTASLVKTGPGILTISGTNALTGSVTLKDGIISVSDFTALSAATDATGNLIFQGGKLKYTGTAPATMTRGFTVDNGGAGFISSGSDALTISGDMDFADGSASNRTLSLGGTTDIAIENIYDPGKISAADVSKLFTKLEKQDTNKWIVLGAGAGFVDDAQTEINIQNGELGFAMGALGKDPKITLGGTGGATATLGWFNDGATTNTEDVSGRITLRDSARAAFDIPSNNTVNFLTGINGGVGTSLTKKGGGTLELRESSSFTGGFTISGGTVKAFKAGSVGTNSVTVGTGSINSSSILVVNANLLNPITVKSDGTLTTENPDQSVDDITVNSGGTIVPGGSQVGTMTVRNLTLKGGSIVNWQMSDATGTAGIGYDTFILNTLLLTDASVSNRVTVHISAEVATNFDKSITQSFKFAKFNSPDKFNSSYTNVTSLFEIDASDFELINGLPTDKLVWYMTVSASREYLYITAMPIPEPSTYGLGLGALALAAAAVRRRKQKKNSTAV